MELKRDWASKAWLQPAHEPSDSPVQMMDFLAVCAASAAGLLAVIVVLSLA